MAINPDLVDLDAANAEMPPLPDATNVGATHTAFFFSAPGSVHRATHSGPWGDARESNAEFGERYLAAVSRGTIRVLDDIERTFAAMPPRQRLTCSTPREARQKSNGGGLRSTATDPPKPESDFGSGPQREQSWRVVRFRTLPAL